MALSQQIRQARHLLSWTIDQASEAAGLPAAVIARAEIGDGAPDITLPELARLLKTFETAGARMGFDGSVTLNRPAA